MLKLSVPDMTCDHCVLTVTKAVKSIDANASVNVDLPSHLVVIESRSEISEIVKAMEAVGYPGRSA